MLHATTYASTLTYLFQNIMWVRVNDEIKLSVILLFQCVYVVLIRVIIQYISLFISALIQQPKG
jgi:hypothetical protein